MAKKKEQAEVVETAEMKAKFQQKLIELLALGKKKKNILEYQEISDFFKDMNLDPEKLELVLDYLEHNGIDVLKISDDDDDVDDDILLDEEDEVEDSTGRASWIDKVKLAVCSLALVAIFAYPSIERVLSGERTILEGCVELTGKCLMIVCLFVPVYIRLKRKSRGSLK